MAEESLVSVKPEAVRPGGKALAAFIIFVIIGGSNAVAVRFSNQELPPFWGAAMRFAAAGLIFWIIVALRRIPLPKGQAMVGVLIFGFLSVGLAYALLYWALLEVSAGLTMMVLAFVPLLTFIFALLHGQELFRWRGLVGESITTSFIAGGALVLAGVWVGLSANKLRERIKESCKTYSSYSDKGSSKSAAFFVG